MTIGAYPIRVQWNGSSHTCCHPRGQLLLDPSQGVGHSRALCKVHRALYHRKYNQSLAAFRAL